MAKTLSEQLLSSKKADAVITKITERIAFLTLELEAMQPMLDEMAELKAALVTYAEEKFEADDEVEFANADVEITVGAKEIVRKVKSMSALFDFLGKKVFLEAASFPMKQIDTLLTKDDQKKFVTRKRVGTRSCKIKML